MWSLEISAWAYDGFIKIFAEPSIQITSLAMGVGVAYLLGFVHITTICYLPAALAAMPMAQAAETKRDWLKTVAVLALCMVAVTALFGVLISAPASLFAGHHRQPQDHVADHAAHARGHRHPDGRRRHGRAWPDPSPAAQLAFGPGLGGRPRHSSSRTRYRRAAIMGLWIAATFGIICPKPLYLGLLVYVAVIGSAAYGALALGAYGLGLASTVALGGLVLMRASRAARFNAWLAAREEDVPPRPGPGLRGARSDDRLLLLAEVHHPAELE